MHNFVIYSLFLCCLMTNISLSSDILVTNSGRIIIGRVIFEGSDSVEITNHRKTYNIPKNRIEMLFKIPDLNTEGKLSLLPRGLPISLEKIAGLEGIFYGLSGKYILVRVDGEIKQIEIAKVDSLYIDDFPDIRLFNLLNLIEHKRNRINIRTYELGEIECEVLEFDSNIAVVKNDNDTISLAIESLLSVAGETLFDFLNRKNIYSKRYLLLPSAYIGSAEETYAEIIDLYYANICYNISSWLQISGGFAAPILFDQRGKYPISFSVKGAAKITGDFKMFSELMVFHKDGNMPGLCHIGLNYGSTENNISIIYSYQSKLDTEFSQSVVSMAGVFRVYSYIYFTSEISAVGERESTAFIASNALQINLEDISFKIGAIYFIAEKKEYSILPLLKAEFDF